MKKKLFASFWMVMMFFVLGNITVTAQELVDMTEYLSRPQGDHNVPAGSGAGRLESLLSQPGTVAFYRNAVYVPSGDLSPACIDTDVPSLPVLFDRKDGFGQVELVKLRVTRPEDLQVRFDLSRFTQFRNLKYLLIQCEIACERETVERCILGSAPDVVLLFNLSIPN